MSLDKLNANENLSSAHEDENQLADENGMITFFLTFARLYFYLYKEYDYEEEESEDYLPIDLWENNVNVDPDSANKLQQIIGGILGKCRSTIKMINKSCNLSSYVEILKDSHDLKNNLSIDCKNRWNSTKFMITNLLKYKSLFGQLHSDKHILSLNHKIKAKLGNLELTADDWFIIQSIEQVLTPFEKATKMMSGQKYPTVGIAFCATRMIKDFIESNEETNTFIYEMKHLSLAQLVHYIDSDTDQFHLIIVSMCHFVHCIIYR